MAPKMASIMVTAMLIMTFAFWMYTIAVVLMRVRRTVLERERQTSWVKELVGGQTANSQQGANSPGVTSLGEKE
jgi:heme exporter protein C